jgi:hypothetical protein
MPLGEKPQLPNSQPCLGATKGVADGHRGVTVDNDGVTDAGAEQTSSNASFLFKPTESSGVCDESFSASLAVLSSSLGSSAPASSMLVTGVRCTVLEPLATVALWEVRASLHSRATSSMTASALLAVVAMCETTTGKSG